MLIRQLYSIANRLSQEQRKAAGWTLLLAGTAISIPIGLEIMGKKSVAATEGINLRQAA